MAPLTGIQVLDLGQFITGPYAGVLLAEMGAEVIKVEPPSGDPFRKWEDEGLSPSFVAYNRGKRSIILDLKTERDRHCFLELAQNADVLIENFRPGVTKRLGIDYDTLAALNPRLIYCSITGFGPDGPYRDRASYDSVAQGLSGLNGLILDPETPRLKGPAFGDTLTGLTAAFGIVTALVGKERSGKGQHLEVNMLQALTYFVNASLFQYLMAGKEPGPYTRPITSQSYAFRAGDGNLFLIHLSSPKKFWENLCEAIERKELLADARFTTRQDRQRNYDQLQEELQKVFETRNREEWLRRLIERDVPCAPVNRVSEVVSDPQVKHLGILDVETDPSLGRIARARPPVHFCDSGAPPLGRPPLLGEHTEKILARLKSKNTRP